MLAPFNIGPQRPHHLPKTESTRDREALRQLVETRREQANRHLYGLNLNEGDATEILLTVEKLTREGKNELDSLQRARAHEDHFVNKAYAPRAGDPLQTFWFAKRDASREFTKLASQIPETVLLASETEADLDALKQSYKRGVLDCALAAACIEGGDTDRAQVYIQSALKMFEACNVRKDRMKGRIQSEKTRRESLRGLVEAGEISIERMTRLITDLHTDAFKLMGKAVDASRAQVSN